LPLAKANAPGKPKNKAFSWQLSRQITPTAAYNGPKRYDTGAEVSPKMGYVDITWAPEAQFIWGPDLEQSNTVLCRLTVN
jgi:hypothetical protein